MNTKVLTAHVPLAAIPGLRGTCASLHIGRWRSRRK